MNNNKKHFLVAGIAALLMAGSLGLNLNTIGVYLQPIANSLGVTTGDISMHSTLISMGIAFGAFLIPPVLERFNFRLVVFIATIFTAGATFGMAFATEVWMFNVLGLIRGTASAFFGIVALQLLINNWFIKKHGMVTSIVFSFSGIAGAIFSPILSNIIQSQGWQAAFIVQAILFIVLSLPGILIPYRLSPQEEGLEPYGYSENILASENTGEKESSRKPFSFGSVTFISTVLFAVLIASLTALNQHLAGIGVDFGFTATIGALMISACMLGNIIFKLVIGMISDSIGTIIALISMVGTVTVGLVLLLLGQSDFIILAGSFLLGAMYSVAAVGLSIFVKHIYSDEEFPKVFPIVNFMSNIGGAIAVSAYGYSYDLSGGYQLAVVASIVITVIIASLILIANRTSLVKNA
jgi:sugar phosphate permease